MILLKDINSFEEIRKILLNNGAKENEVDALIKAAFKPLYSGEAIEKYRRNGVQEMKLGEFLAEKQKAETLDVTFLMKTLENDLMKIDIDGKIPNSDALHSKIYVVIAIINFINQLEALKEQNDSLNTLKEHEIANGATSASQEVIAGNISLQLEVGKLNACMNEMVNLIAQLVSYNDKGKFSLYDHLDNKIVKSVLPTQKADKKKPEIEFISDFQCISKEIKDLRNAQTAHFDASSRTKTLSINMSYLKQLLSAFDELISE